MILVTAGLPGRFAESCESLLAALAARGSFSSFNADSLAVLGKALLERPVDTALAVTRQPAHDLAVQLKTQSRPILIALERPEDCVAALIADHGLSYMEAVRSTANSCAALHALLSHPGAMILRREDHRPSRDIAHALAVHYALGLPPGEIDRLADQVQIRDPAAAPATYLAETEGVGGAGADHLLPPLLAGALAPAEAWLGAGGLQEVIWHRDLFFAGDRPQKPPAPWIDVTGPGRCLFHGPYIRMPAGNWSCALLLGCGVDAVGLSLVAEIFAGAVLAHAEFTVSEAGFFEMEFSCTLSGDQPVEIRLFNPRAAFEGHIALIQATLRPLKAVRLPAKAA
jgi:hypothetical protein